ncbi:MULTISPECIES: protein translocase subunit SecF [unclassified Salinibacterium]|uniref:protein translocase subunit SecF n=1 Tax=unclassified Salinibacterium TaxID=2632331 RepID=UPI0018CE965D|nr:MULTISPECIES: protein translocase subunit SecF [unclassified Salinibacterium]MBH0054117.1 protein translocase subunit SecF [Salinibacterium sp. SWN139]MBH0083403.1 protein translocase subunit SecF [Salinibacterium sp. SWN167]
MASFSKFGNDLYTGDVSINFIGRRKVWYTLAAVLLAISIVVPALRGGYVFGIEFTGGSQFQIDSVEQLSDPDANAEAQTLATDTVIDVVADADPKVTVIGTGSLRIQTEQLETDESNAVRDALADAFGVDNDLVAASFVGPSWGADITSSALRALIVFIALAAVMMAIYFRTWKMSIAAMIALLHDIVITAGVYGVFGFEITPSAVIGFLTILGFSLYDTVVVFDKIRENTSEDGSESRRTFAESVNLAVNQTLVRSINTGVVAALPVAAILFIGAYVLGAGTLRDIALALFIGIIVGTYSTIFIAAPLYAQFRQNEPAILSRTKRLTAARAADKGGK